MRRCTFADGNNISSTSADYCSSVVAKPSSGFPSRVPASQMSRFIHTLGTTRYNVTTLLFICPYFLRAAGTLSRGSKCIYIIGHSTPPNLLFGSSIRRGLVTAGVGPLSLPPVGGRISVLQVAGNPASGRVAHERAVKRPRRLSVRSRRFPPADDDRPR